MSASCYFSAIRSYDGADEVPFGDVVYGPLLLTSGRRAFIINYVKGYGNLLAFNFGKHEGHFLRDVAALCPTYLTWMLKDSTDFSENVKRQVRWALRLLAKNPKAAPGLLKPYEDGAVGPRRRATCEGTLKWNYKDELVFNVGMYKDNLLVDVAVAVPHYLDFMLDDATDFPKDVRRYVEKAKGTIVLCP